MEIANTSKTKWSVGLLIILAPVISLGLGFTIYHYATRPDWETRAWFSTTMALEDVCVAQYKFKQKDYYGVGYQTLASFAGHLYELPDGTDVDLIDRDVALAFGKDPSGKDAVPRMGYRFLDISPRASALPPAPGDDPITEAAYCAYPVEYSRGLTGNTIIIQYGYAIYSRDLGGKPVYEYPDDLSGWVIFSLVRSD